MPLLSGSSQAKQCPFGGMGPKGHRHIQASDNCAFRSIPERKLPVLNFAYHFPKG